jgi:hypothetical protein
MEKIERETQVSSPEKRGDSFSKMFFFGLPFTVPVIVIIGTYLCYPFCPKILIWLPLLVIYWSTIWAFALLYYRRRGGVFSKERFKPTLKLQGRHLWLQYLLVYGPLAYSIPLFLINYAAHLSATMYGAILLAAAINGPSEEVFWRACLEDAGTNAGVSKKNRLVFAPVAFALWHTAFVIHLFPWDQYWLGAWAGVMLITWSSGLIWLWVLQTSGRLVPQVVYHACANFLNIFPMFLVTVLHLYF